MALEVIRLIVGDLKLQALRGLVEVPEQAFEVLGQFDGVVGFHEVFFHIRRPPSNGKLIQC